MGKTSVKIKIAGREYPLTINNEEEQTVQLAAQSINNNIKKLQENYAVKDMQDLLAMTALQFASKELSGNISKEAIDFTLQLKEKLNKLLSSFD